jgi:flagellar protein FlgJ
VTAQEDFVNQAAPAAQSAQAETGVPASVTLAQAALESGWGQHHVGAAQKLLRICD